jgi:hypothetical protein
MTMSNKIVVNIQSQDKILVITSKQKKSYYNLPNLYKILKDGTFNINKFINCHLAIYPYVSVIFVAKTSEMIEKHKNEIEELVRDALWNAQE